MRKSAVFILVLFSLLLGMAVPAFAQDRPSIPDLLANDSDGRFTTLLAAVDAAGLSETLSGEGPFTVFAPTNDAFAAALESLGLSPLDVMGNPELLTAILTYHVVPGRYFARNLFGGATLTTVQGEEVTVGEGEGGGLVINDVAISDIDNIGSNGVVQVIEGVLLPPSVAASLAGAAATPEPTEAPVAEATEAPVAEATAAPAGQAAARPSLVELLSSDDRFTTLVAAVQAAGLGDALSAEGPFTILAPTNDAFAAALEFLGLSVEDVLANPDVLTQILTYHVIPDRLLFRNIIGGRTATTLNGAEVVFYEGAGGRLTVNGASISDVDNIGSNGVIQVIDSVLIPPGVVEPAHVRVAHFSPDAPAVDVWLNNSLSAVQNLGYGSVTEWIEVTPNPALRVAVAPTGTSDFVIGPADVTFAPGSWTTIAAVGSAADGTIAPAIIAEDYSALGEGEARITVFHGIEGAPAVNIFANGSLLVGELGFPGSLADGTNDGAYTLTVPAGTYDLSVNAGGAPILTQNDVEIVAGTNYFIAAIGTADAPSLLIQSTDQIAMGG